MVKGDAISAFMILGSVIILMTAVYVTVGFVYGTKYTKPTVEESSNQENEGTTVSGCELDSDCTRHVDGSACLNIADPNFPERFLNFCGCYTNDQCASTADVQRSGVCGQDNKC